MRTEWEHQESTPLGRGRSGRRRLGALSTIYQGAVMGTKARQLKTRNKFNQLWRSESTWDLTVSVFVPRHPASFVRPLMNAFRSFGQRSEMSANRPKSDIGLNTSRSIAPVGGIASSELPSSVAASTSGVGFEKAQI